LIYWERFDNSISKPKLEKKYFNFGYNSAIGFT